MDSIVLLIKGEQWWLTSLSVIWAYGYLLNERQCKSTGGSAACGIFFPALWRGGSFWQEKHLLKLQGFSREGSEEVLLWSCLALLPILSLDLVSALWHSDRVACRQLKQFGGQTEFCEN